MACFFPRPAWQAKRLNPATGRRPIAFNLSEGSHLLPTSVPCGQCIGCRLDWAGDWAARCEKEAKLYLANSFITLTYGDEHLPIGATTRSSLSKRDFQLFMKRLRKEYPTNAIRFFATGEYGDKNQRAHYHALLFNHQFPDLQLWRLKPSLLYRSASLETLWSYGFASVGNVTYQSAGYVARYSVKKLRGFMAKSEYFDREPPFVLMSRRPGLGSVWYDKFKSDIYPSGQLVVGEGKLRRTPLYFDNKFRQEQPEAFASMKKARRIRARANPHNTPARLNVRAQLAQANLTQNPRSL